MGYIEAAILGLVQGLCEFLPVSSSGHLVIFQTLFGLSENASQNVLFTVMLHLATLVAVIIAFRKRVWGLITGFFKLLGAVFTGKFSWKKAPGDQRMLILVIIATLPLFIFVPFTDKIEELFSSMLLVGIALLITALMLTLADYVARSRSRNSKHRSSAEEKTAETMTVRDSLIVGLFQCVALTPGISRSGSTITGGLLCGLTREFAVEFSFIMSIPAVLGSAVLKVKDAVKLLPGVNIGPYLVGMVIAGISGFLAIKLISFLVKKDRFGIFAYYCAAAGIFAIIYSIVVK